MPAMRALVVINRHVQTIPQTTRRCPDQASPAGKSPRGAGSHFRYNRSTMTASRKRARPRGPGRPRSDTSRSAILKAAHQLLRESGSAGFTVEGVAARAGAGKATIYRWWQSKGTLAIEAFLVELAPRLDAAPHTASALADLRVHVHHAAAIYRGRAGQLLREL